MGTADADEVELVYAQGRQVFHWRGRCAPGMTIADVLDASAVLARHPEIDFAHFGVGVWGISTNVAREVHAGDRIEIYPPLAIDPKVSRRLRAAQHRGRTQAVLP